MPINVQEADDMTLAPSADPTDTDTNTDTDNDTDTAKMGINSDTHPTIIKQIISHCDKLTLAAFTRVSKMWGLMACKRLHRYIVLDGNEMSLGPFATERPKVAPPVRLG